MRPPQPASGLSMEPTPPPDRVGADPTAASLDPRTAGRPRSAGRAARGRSSTTRRRGLGGHPQARTAAWNRTSLHLRRQRTTRSAGRVRGGPQGPDLAADAALHEPDVLRLALLIRLLRPTVTSTRRTSAASATSAQRTALTSLPPHPGHEDEPRDHGIEAAAPWRGRRPGSAGPERAGPSRSRNQPGARPSVPDGARVAGRINAEHHGTSSSGPTRTTVNGVT